MYFIYGEAELAYLRRKDKRLAAVIDRIGPVERTVDPDLFSAVVHHIIGQQISMKAQATIWQRMQDTLGSVSAETILAAGVPALQALGMTFRKAEYLTDLAGRIVDGSFNLEAVRSMDDAEAIRALSSLRGIGGDDPAVLPAAAGYFQLRRPCDPARSAHGLPPSPHRPPAV